MYTFQRQHTLKHRKYGKLEPAKRATHSRSQHRKQRFKQNHTSKNADHLEAAGRGGGRGFGGGGGYGGGRDRRGGGDTAVAVTVEIDAVAEIDAA